MNAQDQTPGDDLAPDAAPEFTPAAATPCEECPWRTSNKGRPVPPEPERTPVGVELLGPIRTDLLVIVTYHDGTTVRVRCRDDLWLCSEHGRRVSCEHVTAAEATWRANHVLTYPSTLTDLTERTH